MVSWIFFIEKMSWALVHPLSNAAINGPGTLGAEQHRARERDSHQAVKPLSFLAPLSLDFPTSEGPPLRPFFIQPRKGDITPYPPELAKKQTSNTDIRSSLPDEGQGIILWHSTKKSRCQKIPNILWTTFFAQSLPFPTWSLLIFHSSRAKIRTQGMRASLT